MNSEDDFSYIFKYFEHWSNRSKNECEMINHRLVWLWTLQGLLFTSFAIFIKIEVNSYFVSLIICVIGILSCVSVGYSVHRAHKVIESLEPGIKILKGKIEERLKLEIKIDENGCFNFLHPWRCLPWFVMLIWFILLFWVVINKFKIIIFIEQCYT